MNINDLPKIDDTEVWLPYYEAPEYYFVSSKGRVFSTRINDVMTPRQNRKGGGGYLYVGIHKGDGAKAVNRYIHRMVAIMFKPNPYGYKYVRHTPDPNILNCEASNVEWGTQKQNIQECISQGRSKANNSWGGNILAVKVDTGETHTFINYTELTKVTGVKRQSAYCAIRDGRVTKGWKFYRSG